jgi:hypothetical protein
LLFAFAYDRKNAVVVFLPALLPLSPLISSIWLPMTGFHSHLWVSNIWLWIFITFTISTPLWLASRSIPYLVYCDQCQNKFGMLASIWCINSIFFGYVSKIGLAGSNDNSIFLRNLMLFCIMAAEIYIPTNGVWRFLLI